MSSQAPAPAAFEAPTIRRAARDDGVAIVRVDGEPDVLASLLQTPFASVEAKAVAAVAPARPSAAVPFASFASFAMLAVSASLAALACAPSLAAPVAVSVPSLDAPRSGGAPVQLPGTWFAAAPRAGVSKPAPAIVLLHGCGGLFERPRGSGPGAAAGSEAAVPPLASRYTGLAERLNTLGIHVLVTDSLTPRGERELCTQRTGQRRVTQLNRRRDALGALAWLAAQPGVDGARIGLLGWSNGGSTVLAATNLAHPEVAKAAVRPSLAVAFYPGCEAEAQRGYRPSAALLMLLGEADDWTAAAPCKAMAAAAVNTAPVPAPQWQSYEGAHHGFDGTAALRLRRDVPNGVHPGEGVHVGANPPARAAARERLDRFLRETWALAP